MFVQPVTGKFVRSIALETAAYKNHGLAISPDGTHMVVSHSNHRLTVYSLPGGVLVRTFGGKGSGRGQFEFPSKLCFGVTGNILVVEEWNKRVQEVALTGDHVRFIGVGVIDDRIGSIAANAELIVVGKYGNESDNRIMMFDAVTGAFVRAFGRFGVPTGQLKNCNGIRFMPDRCHIVVVEQSKGLVASNSRLSVYTLAGEFVRCIGMGELESAGDVEFSDNGDYNVCESPFAKGRVSVYSADGSTRTRQWGGEGDTDGTFTYPTALAMCGGQLFVLDQLGKRVQVFE